MFFETTVFPPYKPKEDPVFTLNIPQIKKTLVEVDQLEMEKFVGIENFLLNSTECEKVVIPSTGTSKEMKDSLVSTCEVLRQTIFNLDIEGIDKIGNLKPYIETGYRWGEDLTNMNDHFWSFYLEVESFKMVLKNISTSTKK